MKMNKEYLSTYEGVYVVGDGDSLCARFNDFIDLQDSAAGFGNTDAEALVELAKDVRQSRDNLKAELTVANEKIAELERRYAATTNLRCQIRAADERVEVLEAALRPFAGAWIRYAEQGAALGVSITPTDYRKAADALAGKEPT